LPVAFLPVACCPLRNSKARTAEASPAPQKQGPKRQKLGSPCALLFLFVIWHFTLPSGQGKKQNK